MEMCNFDQRMERDYLLVRDSPYEVSMELNVMTCTLMFTRESRSGRMFSIQS